MNWIVDAKVGPDGALYFCERQAAFNGSIRRLRPSGAGWASFGQGCAGSAGTPALLATGTPQLGQTFAMTVTGLTAPAQTAFGMLGFARDEYLGAPLPVGLATLGMPGCDGWIAPDRFTFLLGQSGQATWNLPIPATQSLSGLAIFAQALVADPGTNTFGAVVSNGGEGVIR